MFKNKFRSALTLALVAPLASCSSFFQEDSVLIKDVKTEVLEDGSTQITISYYNEDREDTVIVLPKGQEGTVGKDGVGIKDVLTEPQEDGTTKVTITFTDDEEPAKEFIIPTGVSVSSISYEEIEGEPFMVVHYSNGVDSEPIPLVKGPQGNGITSYEVVENEDGSISIRFEFSESDPIDIMIPAPKKGDSIVYAYGYEDGDNYVLMFMLTDGTYLEPVTLPKPQAGTQWLSGVGSPSGREGNIGDFYFDTANNVIYQKRSATSWTRVVSLGNGQESREDITIRFDLNANGDPTARMSGFDSYTIKAYSTFSSSGYAIPIPVRDSFDFAGWYTKREITATAGKLDDLTVLVQDATFYAIWEAAVTA